MGPAADPAYGFPPMLHAECSGTWDNDGYGMSYNLCGYDRTYRICQHVRPMTMYDNALMHPKFASHSCLVNACAQNPLQTDELSQPVHTWASTLIIQPVDRAEQVDPVRYGHMKIHHSSVNTGMTQKLLDRYYVHTKLKQMCSITMPECVRADVFCKTTLQIGRASCRESVYI